MKTLVHKIRRRVALVRNNFGSRCVQSPYAWQFINDVLRNRTPYHAYADLKDQLRVLSRRDRKIAKMLLRLANHLQPATVWLPEEYKNLAPFVERGCSRAVVQQTAANARCSTLVRFCNAEGSTAAVVVLGLNSTAESLSDWRTLQASPWTTLTFDLGYTGVILANSAYAKQHYICRIRN
ncbi:MAG: hypothetical protein IJT90_00245 [Bacteroidaceae bacterium]|nr:hypothetical protein [Bacteroidaceae bacterium]